MFLLWKEIITHFRYRMVWINKILTPFFLFAPFVYLANTEEQYSVFISLICWFGLNQFFFSIASFIMEERMLGTFVNLFIYPFDIKKFLWSKGIYTSIEYIIISLITTFFFFLCKFPIGNLVHLLLILIVNSICMMGFSILYLAVVMRYRRFYQFNSLVQQVLGVFSGYTSDINYLPYCLRVISNLIPLTFIIQFAKLTSSFQSLRLLFIALFISLNMYIVGIRLVTKNYESLRKKGDQTLW